MNTISVIFLYIRDTYDSCNIPDEGGNSFKIHPTPHCEEFTIFKLTVVYSRPKNLQDKLVPSTLFDTPYCTIKHMIETLRLLNGQAS